MFTNTFAPHIGGVRRSIDVLTAGLRERGHQVLTVAPSFEGYEIDTQDVIRVPALEQVYGTDFSFPLPFGRSMRKRIEAFQPDILHSHHPFLLGSTALRFAAMQDVPVVYTYHTRYDFYGCYVLTQSNALSRALRNLSRGYCSLCNAVIAPSESIAGILQDEGLSVPIQVIPTGIDIGAFEGGNGPLFRTEAGIRSSTFLVGHIGRLSEEKNLPFLTEALVDFLLYNALAHVVIGGGGNLKAELERRFKKAKLMERVHFSGIVTGQNLADFYAALDVFAFASLSETQGLVLQEAMATGRPVIALDSPGVREVVSDHITGRLLPAAATPQEFSHALSEFAHLPDDARKKMQDVAKATAKTFTVEKMIDNMLRLYREVCMTHSPSQIQNGSEWDRALRGLEEERLILSNIFHALGDAVTASEGQHAQL
jgi:glycosyltransferase involved in cell wall biosynthesis